MVLPCRDVLCVPVQYGDHRPGIYDRGRKLVAGSAYFQGVPNLHPVRAGFVTRLDPAAFPEAPTGADYIFADQLITHYGHFLIGTLARLWALRLGRSRATKLVLVDREPPEYYFRVPHIREILGAMGLTEADFVTFREPVRFRSLLVPSPAIEETSFVHDAFATLCNGIGRVMTANVPPLASGSDRPVFLSKANLTKGVTQLVNEDEFCAALERAGVEIVFPSDIPVREQILIYRDRPNLSGIMGSALHTSVFVPERRMLVLNYENTIWSTQILIDRANRNTSEYVWPEGGIVSEGPGKGFPNRFRLLDPERTATQFLHALEAFTRATGLTGEPSRTASDTSPKHTVGLSRPIGRQISFGKPARQSSVSQWSRAETVADDAAGALSGRLTGTYQFHTGLDDGPWWEVDLGSQAVVQAVRVYNRLDAGGERASSIEIESSTDRETWKVLHRRLDRAPFGGADGNPMLWIAAEPELARFVRLTVREHIYLHLDQVQVFGWMLDEA